MGMKVHRPKRARYLVYSRRMASGIPLLDELPGKYDQRRSPGGGYVAHFVADDGPNGAANWSWRHRAKIFRSLAEAIACALIVSEHEGVGDAVVLDAHTTEKVW